MSIEEQLKTLLVGMNRRQVDTLVIGLKSLPEPLDKIATLIVGGFSDEDICVQCNVTHEELELCRENAIFKNRVIRKENNKTEGYKPKKEVNTKNYVEVCSVGIDAILDIIQDAECTNKEKLSASKALITLGPTIRDILSNDRQPTQSNASDLLKEEDE
jgi:hypothetical protein